MSQPKPDCERCNGHGEYTVYGVVNYPLVVKCRCDQEETK